MFKSLETVTPQQITTTKSNKSESETTQKPTQQKNTNKETNKSAKSEQKGKTLTADKFKEITDGMFSMLDKNQEALRNTSVQKIVDGIQKGGVVLTPKQVKSIENRLGMRQERLKEQDNKNKTTNKQDKQAQKGKQNKNNQTKGMDAREAAVRKVKGVVYGKGIGNISNLWTSLSKAKRSPKGVLEKFIGELKKDYV